MAGSPVSIGGALRDVLRNRGLGYLLHEGALRERWAEVVGARAAEIATLETLKDFVLHLRVKDAAWRNELHYQREAIRAKANAVLGADLVREVRLR